MVKAKLQLRIAHDLKELSLNQYISTAELAESLSKQLSAWEKSQLKHHEQAQRIAIARGLLRPGGVLLLNEPTSSLDGERERTLLARLAARTEGKTILLVTHRNQALSGCDATIQLERNQ